MSIFSSQSTWPAQCSSANQSPVNLVQSQAKPCNVTCDLVMDDGFVSSATVGISNEGLYLSGNLGSLKFREQSYVCTMLQITHPASHTMEGVQPDGEITAYCHKPTGELLCVSSLFRVNTTQTRSYTFFKQFVSYALTTGETQVKLKDWSLAMMVPPTSQFFSYAGSSLLPPCTSCEWVVFQSMINIDTDDFAYLVKSAEAGYRTIQGLGDRTIFFNDTQNLSGIMPNDGKLYLKLKPTGNTSMPNLQNSKNPISLKNKSPLEDSNNPKTWSGKGQKALQEHIDSNGGLAGTIELWLMIVLILLGSYWGYQAALSNPITGQWVPPWAKWLVDETKALIIFIITYIYDSFVWMISILRSFLSFFTFGNSGQPLTSGLTRVIPDKVIS